MDAINYLNFVRDACGFLEACLEEAPSDVILLRQALSDITRTEETGKFDLDVGKSGEELLQSLAATASSVLLR